MEGRRVEARNASAEFSARTVDEATALGLATMGKTADEVEVTVVSRGSRGLLGLRSESARVRITVKPTVVPVKLPEVLSEPEPRPSASLEALASPPAGSVQETARQVLADMLRLMSINGKVTVKPAPSDSTKDGAFVLDVTGLDLGILIGRRGETLSALQYLVRQIVGHKTGEWVPIIVDIEQYKERRNQSLQSLAQRMSDRVASSGQAVTLEAMSPAERRIVHIALREHPAVTTRSIGEGDNRKVMILPKE
jgi:spoIIIJ-associated protein